MRSELKSFLKITEAEQMNVLQYKTNIKSQYKLKTKTYDKKYNWDSILYSHNMNLFDFEALNWFSSTRDEEMRLNK